MRVNDLNVRTEPGLSSPLLRDTYGQFDAGGVVRLNDGDHVLVVSDARSVDGSWWLMIGATAAGPTNPVAVGWAVAGTAQEPWIEADNSWCPGAGPTFETLVSLTRIERLGCYAPIPLTFAARQATIAPGAGLGGACDVTPPSWLLCDHINYSWVNRDGGYAWEFLLHFDPATGIPETELAREGESRLLTITGHFMDPAATACAPSPAETPSYVSAFLTCSAEFVLEAIE